MYLRKKCLLYHKKIPRVRTDREEKVREIPRKRSNIFPTYEGEEKRSDPIIPSISPCGRRKGKIKCWPPFLSQKKAKKVHFYTPCDLAIFFDEVFPPPSPLELSRISHERRKTSIKLF